MSKISNSVTLMRNVLITTLLSCFSWHCWN